MIRTRIAPSPTGFLHLGTARTALFNYLFAAGKGGKFILRIDDTDRARSTKAFEKDIISGFAWLGLNYDEQYYQSKRLEIYERYFDELLKKKAVYQKEGAYYFAVADYGTGSIVKWNDLTRGEISFALKDLKDFVVKRSDGSPLFLFTGLVDDLDLKISHVIRGEDQISNTPLQIMIAAALGKEPPRFGHLSLILAPDRSKLSKRFGAVAIAEYKKMGIVPEAMLNYLALLGWNPGTDEEFFSLQQLVKKFAVERVHKSGAIFDINKLIHINRLWLKTKSDQELVALVKPFSKRKLAPSLFKRLVHICRDRLARLVEFDSLTQFVESPNYSPSLLVFNRSTKPKSLAGLKAVLNVLAETKLDDLAAIRAMLAQVVAENKLANGDVFWPVRAALSGAPASPAPDELLWALGKEESIARLKQAVAKLLS